MKQSLYPGQRVGRWTLLSEAPKSETPASRRPRWLCRCDCGTEKFVLGQSLRLALCASVGGSRSCGCLAIETSTRHGSASKGRPSAEYLAWINAKKRCNNPRNASYRDYGGRGIRMRAAWTDSFETFSHDMGTRPSPKHSLDRIDPDGDYEPSNCRWATLDIQTRNKRNIRWFAFEGERLILAEVAVRLGITRDQARSLQKRGRLPAWHIVGARMTSVLSSASSGIDFNDIRSDGRLTELYADEASKPCRRAGAL